MTAPRADTGQGRPWPDLVLASGSPRRLDLLAQLGVVPGTVDPADIDEQPQSGERPKPYAERMAREKAAMVGARRTGKVVLAADTVVSLGRRILPKAEDEATARRCLSALSGRRHRVITGLSVITAEGIQHTKSVTSTVTFRRLGADDMDWYLNTGEWYGKAGGYAVQGFGAAFVRQLTGSYSGVVGLPLCEVAGWLTAHLPPFGRVRSRTR